MRFLADQDVWRATVVLLNELGHDVVTAHELGKAAVTDGELLRHAQADGRLLITRDKDYGGLIFFEVVAGAGVIFLRIAPATMGQVHAELARLLVENSQTQLSGAFCVVEPGRYRLRRVAP